jgi:transcriptional regulator with XRE-family HTH domain
LSAINEIIRMLNDKGLKQMDLADRLKDKGVTPQTVTDWKAGRSRTYYLHINEIADFLGATPECLLGFDDGEAPAHMQDLDGAALKRIMKSLADKGLTQSALARHLNLRQQTITDWKTGKSKTYMGLAGDIAAFLEVSPEWLLTGKDACEAGSGAGIAAPEDGSGAQPPGSPAFEARLLGLLEKLALDVSGIRERLDSLETKKQD